MARVKNYSTPNVLVLNYNSRFDKEISSSITNFTKTFKLKSKSGNKTKIELVADIRTRDQAKALINYLSKSPHIDSYSLIEYSNDISGI